MRIDKSRQHQSHWSSTLHENSPNPFELKTRALTGQVTNHSTSTFLSMAYITLFQKIHTLRREHIQDTPTQNYSTKTSLPPEFLGKWREALSTNNIHDTKHIYTDASVECPDWKATRQYNINENKIGVAIVFGNENRGDLPWIYRAVSALIVEGYASDMCSFDAELIGVQSATQLTQSTKDISPNLKIQINTDCQGIVTKTTNVQNNIT
jgi:hypothetical protein